MPFNSFSALLTLFPVPGVQSFHALSSSFTWPNHIQDISSTGQLGIYDALLALSKASATLSETVMAYILMSPHKASFTHRWGFRGGVWIWGCETNQWISSRMSL